MIKVIIVEDDPMVAMINRQFIERFEHFRIIASVGNIEELWSVINKSVPDLILLDVYLPGETGIDFLQTVRQKQLSIPIIMITAAHDIPTIKKSLEYGIIDFLIKPFSYERFELATEKFLQYHSLTTSLEETDQDTLDQILIKERVPSLVNLGCKELRSKTPKGLSKITLKKILHALVEQEGYFSTADIAKEVDLSRISTKKYLLFLNEVGYLSEELKYLAVGRPITVFHVVPEKEHLIMSFK
ncbi:response regulator [Bacillus toyonensis]|nr:response regulator [Bacillus toyonensis]MDT3495130.1 response regulator [Bacillus toyonensis]MDT3495443.1 response regulator [Bacillus toyonensis]MDT3495537.1 response regulator [Bacillus toyonensis]